jgi:hypothetical protein
MQFATIWSGFKSARDSMPMAGRNTIMKIGRNAKTGEFTSVKQAQQRASTHVVETIKRPTQPSKPAPSGSGKSK